LVELQEMTDRKNIDVIKALKAIYKRKVLSKPRVIITDRGKEFGKEFTKALDDFDIAHKLAKAGRHRSVALVERKNQTIGKIIHKI